MTNIIKKKIFLLITSEHPLGVQGVALSEDGCIVGQHLSSDRCWLEQDLGGKTKQYNEHFGEGNWETVRVGPGGTQEPAGLKEAIALFESKHGKEAEPQPTEPFVTVETTEGTFTY